MSIDGSGETASAASRGTTDVGFLARLRAVAIFTALIGAVGSVGLMFRASQHPPLLLLVLFTIWVFAPFVALLWANLVSQRRSAVIRTTLYCVTLVVTLASLAIYGEFVAIKPTGSANAFLWVAVPPASWVFMAIVLLPAKLISRRLSR